MRVSVAIIALVALALTPTKGHAQVAARPLARAANFPVLYDWRFWVGELATARAQSADAATACNGFARGYVDGKFIGRGGTSCKTAAEVMAGAFGFDTVLNLIFHKHAVDVYGDRAETALIFAVPAIVTGIHGTRAILNSEKPALSVDSATLARIGPGGM